jgi:protein-S-isoprenylcysteine O-methyltransferase Ste14
MRDPLGKPPIPWPLFLLAKLSAVVCILALLLKALRGGESPSGFVMISFLCVWLAGISIMALSFQRLGSSLRVGLPGEKTALVTTGIYRYSRNPVYLGGGCLLLASVIGAFSWINLIAALLGALLHHRIALAEEKFLAGRFPEYEAYRKATPRYLPLPGFLAGVRGDQGLDS